MIQGLNRLHMRSMDTLITGNCRKSRPGHNGTSPGAPDPKCRQKTKRNTLIWLLDKNLTLWVGMGEFVRKLVWGLIFEIWDQSHGGDLVEDTISTFLITPIDPETDPKMAGMLVQDDTGWFGGGLGGDLGN